MNVTAQAFMAGLGGTFTVNTATTKAANFYGCEVAKDTVISVLLDQNGNDVTDNYIGDKTVSFKKTTLITATDGNYFSSITVATAGQVDLILKP